MLGLRHPAPVCDDMAFAGSTVMGIGTFRFLGRQESVDLGRWDSPSAPLLWRYHLHYFDDLHADGAAERVAWHETLIDSWVEARLGTDHVGLAPYPTSLRIINWIRWFCRYPGRVRETWRVSLQAQVDLLARRLEYHLLGNHLFENARALVMAGRYFGGAPAERWLSTGLGILEREVREQFLTDGAHFELSPMYHATMLWGLLDLIEISRECGDDRLSRQAGIWREVFRKGMAWLWNLTMPDGQVAFFNDAAFGVAPTAQRLAERASQLGVDGVGRPAGERRLWFVDCRDSGYVRVGHPDFTLLADLARLGPAYQPGHAHADTLSFELAVRGHRLFVNSGTSCYGDGPERQRQRSTFAHNTVCVDGGNSSDVWAGFRVGMRARIRERSVLGTEDRVVFGAGHDGYRRQHGGPIHRREWVVTAEGMAITDQLDGVFRTATASFLLHPDWQVRVQEPQRISCEHPAAGTVLLESAGAVLTVEPATWHPRFGEAIPTARIVARHERQRAVHQIRWCM